MFSLRLLLGNLVKKIYYLYHFYFSISNETKHKNKMQITISRFLRNNLKFKQVFRCSVVERYHCAIMTLRFKEAL